MVKDFFIYGSSFANLLAGTSQSNNLSIQADSDFELQELSFTANTGGVPVTDSTRLIPQCTLLILDTGSGRQLMSSGIDMNTIFGTGTRPFVLRVPKVFRANSALSITLTNYSAATPYNISMSLIGAKIYGR